MLSSTNGFESVRDVCYLCIIYLCSSTLLLPCSNSLLVYSSRLPSLQLHVIVDTSNPGTMPHYQNLVSMTLVVFGMALIGYVITLYYFLLVWLSIRFVN